MPRWTSTRSARIDGAGKLGQHAVAGGLNDTSAMYGDGGIDQRFPDDLSRVSVPSSSGPIKRLYPATSAARIAASRRST